jgi:hypothetical protein
MELNMNICEDCGKEVTKDDEANENAYDNYEGRMPSRHVKCEEE